MRHLRPPAVARDSYIAISAAAAANVTMPDAAYFSPPPLGRSALKAGVNANISARSVFPSDGVPPRLFSNASKRSCCVFAFADADDNSCCTEVCSPASPKVLRAFSKFRSAPIVSSRYWLILSLTGVRHVLLPPVCDVHPDDHRISRYFASFELSTACC